MKGKHWMILAAFFGALGAQLSGLEHGWHDAMSPTFVGGVLAQVATVMAAMFTAAPSGGGA